MDQKLLFICLLLELKLYLPIQVSTPSGDNAERNPLSGSCESIDTAGRRESFLKSAFDSLSGADIDSTNTAGKNK